jgi:primosomal protein N' (replication factor Y)
MNNANQLQIVTVLPATGVNDAYSYRYDGNLLVGDFVRISFGRQQVVGVVWNINVETDLPIKKIKHIEEVYDAKRLSNHMRQYVEKVATWTMTPMGSVLKMVIPSYRLLEPPKRPLKFICTSIEDNSNVVLSVDQLSAAEFLKEKVHAEKYSTTLLDGVTGSGKTEVFFEAVKQAVELGKQALIMMPEIALASGFKDRFHSHFGNDAALWHSQMTPKQRQTVWHGVASGVTKVVIGARSALFLPYANLGVIVVDEEHDPSYKQEENTIYQARDMAVMRGAIFGHAVVLASATPSMETLYNVNTKRYDIVQLPDRFGGALLPDIHTVDMRAEKLDTGCFVSSILHQAIKEVMSKNEQSLLFLNRRGYAPLTLCRSCGARLECPQCTAWLVEHKKSGRTFCHHCGYGGRTPTACPTCDEVDSLVPIGPGVERIAEEIETEYPDANVMILSSDTIDDNGMSLMDRLDSIKKGDVDIIIGTQMTAKGHHFPRLTCVGVIDADIGMKGGDLRAGERTWQLLHQVAGRAGREVLGDDRKGQVFLQTYSPDNVVIESLANYDRDEFIRIEMAQRRMADMPPHSRLVGFIISGKNEKAVENVGRQLALTAPQSNNLQVMGPAIPAFAMLRGKHRRRLLIQADRSVNLQKTIRAWVSSVEVPSSVRLAIDIDPQSFL